MKINAPNGAIAAPNGKREAWEALCRDHELLERLRVTPEELEALRTCALLGSLTGKDDMLFILRMIRGGNTPDFAVAVELDDDAPEPADSLKEPEAPRRNFKPAFDRSTIAAPAPESLAAIARVRVPEQLGVFALIIAFTLGLLWYFVPTIAGFEHHFWSQLGIVPVEATAPAMTASRLGEYRMLIACEVLVVAAALFVTHWIYRNPTKRLKVRPY
ncbi:MAG: hypothetical protein Q7S58_14595 [Candidatus Binatus sp.]|uniref:hypothetical protein n=1 Tax=Candidatus Binatus sp. TaxID=2811406 RepID=UPI002726BB72|nr:hypothetical protein [Candidatus Binatus sp.]MDO8433631.1 hypothetical protein [Candidatus Binatus sp.]